MLAYYAKFIFRQCTSDWGWIGTAFGATMLTSNAMTYFAKRARRRPPPLHNLQAQRAMNVTLKRAGKKGRHTLFATTLLLFVIGGRGFNNTGTTPLDLFVHELKQHPEDAFANVLYIAIRTGRAMERISCQSQVNETLCREKYGSSSQT